MGVGLRRTYLTQHLGAAGLYLVPMAMDR